MRSQANVRGKVAFDKLVCLRFMRQEKGATEREIRVQCSLKRRDHAVAMFS